LLERLFLEEITVGGLAGGFAVFALVPDGALGGQRRIRIDHAIEQAERSPRQDALAVKRCQHRNVGAAFGGQPGIDAGAAHGGDKQADGNRRALVLADFAAEIKLAALAGVHTIQLPLRVLVGAPTLASGAVNWRSTGKLALSMSLWRLQPLKPKAMFDWPLHSQTSPTTTLASVTVLAPPSVAARLPPAAFTPIASSTTCQLPAASEVAVLVWPLKVTVIVLLGAAVPVTGTGLARCSTMLAPNSGASATLASACSQAETRASRARKTRRWYISWVGSVAARVPSRPASGSCVDGGKRGGPLREALRRRWGVQGDFLPILRSNW